MNVLYLNHTGVISGAERSLLELIQDLPDGVDPHLASPPGPLAHAARGLGLAVTEVPGTDASFRLHPLHTPRAMLDLARGIAAVRRVAKATRADVVHANSARAGLVATAVARLGGPPAVVHVRDRLPRGTVSEAIISALVRGARAVIANSAYTAERIPPGRAPVHVIPSPVDVEKLARGDTDRTSERARLGLGDGEVALAMVGQITPWKGQDLAIRVAAALSDFERPVRLLIVGSPKFTSPGTRYDNRAYAEHLQRLVASLDLEERVWFLGEREDVPAILAASDLLLAPSWEEPFGRAIVEAMATGVPPVATETGGPAEIIDHGVDGLLLPPRDADAWADAVRDLLRRPDDLREMGSRAREQAVARFSVAKHVEQVLDVYRAVIT
jgi:glycosyltransferase involved in cell wall biosynthesis